jgi:hypothetical protein
MRFVTQTNAQPNATGVLILIFALLHLQNSQTFHVPFRMSEILLLPDFFILLTSR